MCAHDSELIMKIMRSESERLLADRGPVRPDLHGQVDLSICIEVRTVSMCPMG